MSFKDAAKPSFWNLIEWVLVAHYIHLNPVRAGIINANQLHTYADSSFHQLWYPKQRWGVADFHCCLNRAGDLQDNHTDRKLYRDYLIWIAEEDAEQKRQGFEGMCKGWINGSGGFKQDIIKNRIDSTQQRIVESEISEIRWQKALSHGLSRLEKSAHDPSLSDPKAHWKTTLCCYLRKHFLIPYPWLAKQLHMGSPSLLYSRVAYYQNKKQENDPLWTRLSSDSQTRKNV